MTAKKAFITGINGQDGSYLAEFLLDKGYEVHGVVRRSSSFNRGHIEHLTTKDGSASSGIALHYGDLTDPQNIGSIMRSCALFDCAGIIVGKDNSPELTSSLYKSASGAAEIVNYIRVTNIRRAISFLKKNNYWNY